MSPGFEMTTWPTKSDSEAEGLPGVERISCHLLLSLVGFQPVCDLQVSPCVRGTYFLRRAWGEALIDALALGKIMLFAQELHFANKFKGKPLISVTLFKSAAFALVLGCFKIIEETCVAL